MNPNQFVLTFLHVTKEWKIFRAVGCILLLSISLNSHAQQQTREALDAKRERLEREIEATNIEIDRNKTNRKNTFQQYVLIQKRVKKREELLETFQQEIELIDRSIERNSLVVTALDSDLDRLKTEYAHMLRTAYRQKVNSSRWLFLLSSESMNTAVQRWRYLKQYDAYRRKQAGLIQETRGSLEIKLTQLADQRTQKETLIHSTQQQRNLLARELTQKNEMLGKLKSRESALATRLEQQEASMTVLNEAIAEVIKTEIAKREPKTSAEIATTGNFGQAFGNLAWPVRNGKIVKAFGRHQHTEYANVETNNNGIDIQANPGAEVRSVFEGKVSVRQYVPSNQNLVIISHGSYYTVYANLKSTSVKKGQQVKAGQIIGKLSSSDSQLHFEIWKEKQKLDPARWLR
jgi:septal ring factor EnvC (AmiA/AmiB activator)